MYVYIYIYICIYLYRYVCIYIVNKTSSIHKAKPCSINDSLLPIQRTFKKQNITRMMQFVLIENLLLKLVFARREVAL